MSDQIAIMTDGRIDQIGAPHEVYDAPSTRFVATFLGNANAIPVRIAGRNGEAVMVEAGDLTFPAVPGQPVSGERGEVVLRYEAIRIGPAAQAMPVTTEARIRDVVFSGSSVHYVVETAAGLRLTVEEPHKADEAPLPRGTSVPIGWPERAGRVFPA